MVGFHQSDSDDDKGRDWQIGEEHFLLVGEFQLQVEYYQVMLVALVIIPLVTAMGGGPTRQTALLKQGKKV